MLRAVYEEEFNGFIFREHEEVRKLDYLILALPDVGLVGAIAGLHIIRELDMRDVVGIDHYAAFPPVVVIHKGDPKYPMRIHAREGVGVLITDVPIAPPAIPAFSQAIVSYARVKGVKMLISITGMGIPNRIEVQKPTLYYLANDRESEIEGGRIGAKTVEQGILVGPYALILKEAARRGLSNLVLMVESFVDLPDPEAAAVAVEAVSKITGLKVDTVKLVEEAEKIKVRLKELMRETKSVMAKMGKTYEYRPPLLYT